MANFPPHSQRKYLRIPFKEHGRDFSGCDCGGLVGLVYKEELGIILPDWESLYKNTQIESWNEIKSTIGGFLDDLFLEVLVSPIMPFDVVVFRIAGLPVHVGIAINEYSFMHIMQGYTNVRQERFSSCSWNRRIDGVFRYAHKRHRNGQQIHHTA